MCLACAPLTYACDAGLDTGYLADGGADGASVLQKVSPYSHKEHMARLPLTIYQPDDELPVDFTPYRKKIHTIFDYLAQHPSMALRLEGSTDERGTNERNLALGLIFAERVKKYLISQGVDPARIDTVSFGEEMPVDSGHTRRAWAKNRRVEIKLRQIEKYNKQQEK